MESRALPASCSSARRSRASRGTIPNANTARSHLGTTNTAPRGAQVCTSVGCSQAVELTSSTREYSAVRAARGAESCKPANAADVNDSGGRRCARLFTRSRCQRICDTSTTKPSINRQSATRAVTWHRRCRIDSRSGRIVRLSPPLTGRSIELDVARKRGRAYARRSALDDSVRASRNVSSHRSSWPVQLSR